MEDESDTPEVSLREKLTSLYEVAVYRPIFASGIVILSVFAAILEGIGLSFLIPVIEIAQGQTNPNEVGGIGEVFVSAFNFIGVPFTLEWVIISMSLVMIVRYTASFLVAWLRATLQTNYIRHLQTEGFKNALNAQVSYYDQRGSDEILNAIVTQSEYASQTIEFGVRLLEEGFLSVMYLCVAIYIAPGLTVVSGIILGGVLYGLRRMIESGYSVGDRVADANERIQETVQAGTQGIREVKQYRLADELFSTFLKTVEQFSKSQIKLRRNRAILSNIYQMMAAILIFILIYVALTIASLSLASLGLFLFAMFRLAPRVSMLNNIAYDLEGSLPHLVRTQNFVGELIANKEVDQGSLSPPDPVEEIIFDDVEFAYDTERVLNGISFSVERGDFVAFVGSSGAGKSTIASLISRMYEPDLGQIYASDTAIRNIILEEWRSKISVVRQDPYIFNESLRYNITVGNRDATRREVERVCEIAKVDEFIGDLPNGYDSQLGDDGVRLSGGQRQRVALARALLKDADFLVLDEATSDLDSNLEKEVQAAIESMDQDYGIIAIAHRLSTVKNADRIYTVDNGEIIESGTHRELLDEEGAYAELYSSQSKT